MKLQISLLALAVAASTTVSAQTIWDDINVKIQTDANGNGTGHFYVTNGGSRGSSNPEIITFESKRDQTTISTSNGNKLTVDGKGVHLGNVDRFGKKTDIKLDGVADGNVVQGSSDAVNGDQLYTEQEARKEAIAKEAAIRAAEDEALVDLLIMEETERKEADTQLQNNIDIERSERIKGDRETLAAANAYTDQRVNKIEKHYKAAVASSIAIASLPQPTTAGKNMFSIGAGTWESEQGYALGVSGVTTDNKWVYKVAASGDSRGNFGGGASVGFQW